MVYRRDLEFMSSGTVVRAWHYLPHVEDLASPHGAPAVVMAHGLSLTKDSGLERHAEHFADAGFHVVLFDYRTFGASDGEHRDIVDATAQVEDYLAALSATRALPGVDRSRVALWGTSYSGGIVVEAAYRDRAVAAALVQCPNLDNLASGWFLFLHTPLASLGRLVRAAAADSVAGLLGRPPVYITATGRQGENAAYVNNEARDILDRIGGPTWNNRFAPRAFVRVPFRPIRRVKHLPCRLHIVACDRDDLTPVAPTLRAARLAGSRAELVRYPVGHFGVYVDEVLEDVLEHQTAFLRRELAPSGDGAVITIAPDAAAAPLPSGDATPLPG